MNHEQAIEAATAEAGSWANSIDVEQVVRAYLEDWAGASCDDGENPHRCRACSADELLADFGERSSGQRA